MEQHTEQRTRPRVVTIAVALWWASVIISLVAAAPGMVVSMREAGGAIIGAGRLRGRARSGHAAPRLRAVSRLGWRAA